MTQKLITIIALSVDANYAVLYKEDGSTLTIAQGDARLPLIVEKAREPLSRNEPVEVDVTPIFAKRQEFEDAEKGTGGVIKFFRVAKKFLSTLVNTESPDKVDESAAHVSPLSIGKLPWKAPVTLTETIEQGEPSDEADDPEVEENAPIATPPQSVFITELPNGYNKVGAIKAIRQTMTGLGLREAKDLIESPLPILAATGVEDFVAHTLRHNLQMADVVCEVRETQPGEKLFELSNEQKVAAAQDRMRQVMGNGTPTSAPEFHAPMKDDETIVAVHSETGAIIPDAHKLGHQLKAAAKLQDYTGFTKFVERLSAIIESRGHSVEDLMKFIEKGDLPIADDGCIVIYKRLNSKGQGIYTDVHSGQIKQKVGSYVFMKPGLVDPNRRQDCSNGLHVASLSYLRSFSGDATVVAKVRPEDVFAVPEYNTNKMRVCGYHILAILGDAERRLVNGGGSLTKTPAGKALLNDILAGRHVPITQLVEVGGQRGTNVTYTDVKAEDQVQPELSAAPVEKDVIDTEGSLEPEVPKAADIQATELKPVNSAVSKVELAFNYIAGIFPTLSKVTYGVDLRWTYVLSSGEIPEFPANVDVSILEDAADNVTHVPVTYIKTPEGLIKMKSETKAQTAQRLYDEFKGAQTSTIAGNRATELLAFKKAAKKSWSALGLSDAIGEVIIEAAEKVAPAVKVKTVSGFDDLADKPVKEKAPKAAAPAKAGSPKAQLAECLKSGVTSVGVAQAALLIKKRAKKGWAALGVSDDVVKQIEALTK